jgi:Fe/S biogenesis protein NfuA
MAERNTELTIGPDAPLIARSASAPADSRAVGGDDEMYEAVAELFEQQINPAVAQHGGKVELIDVQEGTVVLRMMGGCQGCGMANVTLRQGIETAIRRALPGFAGLKDITDHAAGTNPYFQAATK